MPGSSVNIFLEACNTLFKPSNRSSMTVYESNHQTTKTLFRTVDCASHHSIENINLKLENKPTAWTCMIYKSYSENRLKRIFRFVVASSHFFVSYIYLTHKETRSIFFYICSLHVKDSQSHQGKYIVLVYWVENTTQKPKKSARSDNGWLASNHHLSLSKWWQLVLCAMDGKEHRLLQLSIYVVDRIEKHFFEMERI